jgi:hypothetical protein
VLPDLTGIIPVEYLAIGKKSREKHMKRLTMSAVLGLSIIGGVLAAPNSANAFRLRNYRNSSLFLGVAGGLPKLGTPFIVWTEDKPVTSNQTFAGSAASVVPGAIVGLFDQVQFGSVGDFSKDTPYRQPMFLGYANAQKNHWIVDDSVTLQSTNWETATSPPRWVGSTCYRFINQATSTNFPPQVLGVAGGNSQLGDAVCVWDAPQHRNADGTTTDLWYNHLDQFWCPID